MFEPHREFVTTQSELSFSDAMANPRSASAPPWSTPQAIAQARFVVPDRARSDREQLAVACLRLVLSAYEDADTTPYAQAYELAERHFDRRWAIEYVRTVSAIVRALRRDRETGFCFLREMHDLLTTDEDDFLSALQAAIDGNSVGVEAAAITLTQRPDGRAAADEFWRLAKLTMAANWLRRIVV